MTERESSPDPASNPNQSQQAPYESTLEQVVAAPYEGTLERVVARVRNELLLFVVAVLILVVALAVLAGNSPYIRFIAVVIALLAFAGVVFHFVQGELKYRRQSAAKGAPSINDKYEWATESEEAQRFWQPFVEEKLQVVTGRFFQFRSFEPTGFVGVGNANGLTELRAFFGVLGLSDFAVSFADSILDGDSLKTNLILIGGPDYNSITDEATRRIKRRSLSFGDPTEYEVAIYDSSTGQTYAPSDSLLPEDVQHFRSEARKHSSVRELGLPGQDRDEDYLQQKAQESAIESRFYQEQLQRYLWRSENRGLRMPPTIRYPENINSWGSISASSQEIKSDYGVIIRTANPFARDKHLLVIAGCFGYGTWAGIRLVMSKWFLEKPQVSSGKPFECLLQTDIVRGTPQEIRLVADNDDNEIRPLGEGADLRQD